jgi:hypothetical protein
MASRAMGLSAEALLNRYGDVGRILIDIPGAHRDRRPGLPMSVAFPNMA